MFVIYLDKYIKYNNYLNTFFVGTYQFLKFFSIYLHTSSLYFASDLVYISFIVLCSSFLLFWFVICFSIVNNNYYY